MMSYPRWSNIEYKKEMLPGGFFQSAVRHAKRGVEPWGCGDVASVSRKGARGHGKPDQMSLPMARSVSSSSSFLTRSGLPILMAGILCRSMSLQTDAFDTRR